MSAKEIAVGIKNKTFSATEIVSDTLGRIEKLDGDIHAFLNVTGDQALLRAKEIDEMVSKGEDPGILAGVPIGIKDNICTRKVATTCGSKILNEWKPPYDATVIEKLRSQGAIVVGKTNMDEFAMGSSTEHSAFGPTKNPHNIKCVPGGSSGGSAAAVASGMVPLALGSDTGGSIRQPAAFCGVVGLKPTYGLVSRYGLVAFASSLDQIGPFSRDVDDSVLLANAIMGHDPLDSTSLDIDTPPIKINSDGGVRGLRIGLVSEFLEGISPEISEAIERACKYLDAGGGQVESCSVPSVKQSLSAYYLIAPAEASSNLARFDGVRFGMRVDGKNAEEMMVNTRTAGFGDEVKRRIMLGTYALSAGYYDAYYGSAQKLRTLVIRDFESVYQKFDVLLSPTTPTTAFEIGAKIDDPLTMYLSDVCTIPTNLAGHPAISVPFGYDSKGLPIGLQVLAPALKDDLTLKVASYLESARENAND
ncbi:MAG: Asp-tRNA(Asn)/Glu-tRNA(Gln) amidotransferase subunit GatA [Acidimicrobiales bacterium]|nr:Asp-tRNA(Asn)/Glu-tRNA(Gln) amidotransferase subunit GatA [Acidimicrobiales bacterium]